MVRGGVTQAVAEQQGMGLLSRMVHTQAREMAYLDPFWMFAIMALAALPLILLMKKSVARGEARCTEDPGPSSRGAPNEGERVGGRPRRPAAVQRHLLACVAHLGARCWRWRMSSRSAVTRRIQR